jgi:predicted RNA-binding protein YlqC (UPF0109 family)
MSMKPIYNRGTRTKTMNPAGTAIQNIFPKLIKSLIQHPDGLRIEVIDGYPIKVSIWVDPADFGLVLGTRGRTFGALIVLARAVALRHDWKIRINELEETGKKVTTRRADIPPNPNWTSEPLIALLRETLKAFCHYEATITPIEREGVTSLEVEINVDEPWKDDEAMQTALSAIFNAIGKMQGHPMQVRYARAEASAMPTENRGRYA